MFRYNQFPELVQASQSLIQKERERYSQVYAAIEEHIQKAGAIIGSAISIHKLLGKTDKEKTDAEYKYDIYTERPAKFSYELANTLAKIAKESDAKTHMITMVMLKTMIPHKHLRIFYDQRPVVNVYSREGIHLNTIRVGKYDIISPEVLLIDIYQTLYNPAAADEWLDAINLESKIYRHFNTLKLQLPTTRGLEDQVDGGDNDGSGAVVNHVPILADILENLKDIEGILVGEHAFYIYTTYLGLQGDKNQRLPNYVTVLSDRSAGDIYSWLDAIIRLHAPRLQLSYREKNVGLIKDFRLTKTTFKLDKRPLLYVYNSTAYELVPVIPYVKQINNRTISIDLGNIFVVSRFLLIELFFVANMLYLGKITPEFAKLKTNLFIRMCKTMRTSVVSRDTIDTIKSRHVGKKSDLFLIFDENPDNYRGVNEKVDVATKMLIKKTKDKYKAKGQSFYDYFPNITLATQGEYRYVGN